MDPENLKNRSRLYYISPRDVRRNRADPVHIMKTCLEFSKYFREVILVTPGYVRKGDPDTIQDIMKLYGMSPSFAIDELPSRLKDDSPAFTERFRKFVYPIIYFLQKKFSGKLSPSDRIYSKCYIGSLPVLLLKKTGLIKAPLTFELASIRLERWYPKFFLRHCDSVVVINRYLQDLLVNDFRIPEEKIKILRFPSQFEEYEKALKRSAVEVRKELSIPPDRPLVVYAGKIKPQMKEITWMLETAAGLERYHFLFVGVQEEYRDYFNKYTASNPLQNVTFEGFQPLGTIYEYLSAADLLLSYHDPDLVLSRHQMLPAKSGIYLCTGKPCIFADLPSLREYLNDDLVWFVEPGNPSALSAKIKEVFREKEEAVRKAQNAKAFAKENTYARSYEEIVDFL
jgi:glycosyltransferase involved in cell wall biosynthesis